MEKDELKDLLENEKELHSEMVKRSYYDFTLYEKIHMG